MAKPKIIAKKMNNIDEVPADGVEINALAVVFRKAAITNINVSQANKANNLFPVFPILISIISPILLPSCLTEAIREPKSWTPPKKIEPTIIHKATGSHPKILAPIGPKMGPAPAMEEK